MMQVPALDAASDHLSDSVGPGMRLLEIGCGTGGKGRSVARGARIVGVDIHLPALLRAQVGAPGSTVVGATNEALPFKDGSFDAVLSYGTLQYTDWPRVVQECRRVMRAGGRGAFVENMEGNPFVRVGRAMRFNRRGKWPSRLTPKHHLTRRELREFGSNFASMHVLPLHAITPLIFVVQWVTRGFVSEGRLTKVYQWLRRVDERMLKTPASRWAWISVILVER
jgi:ubiquinone/menaquinone biosynthesis C-methylase UbiE